MRREGGSVAGFADGAGERQELGFILPARFALAFHPAGHVDAERANARDSLPHVLGAETAGQDERSGANEKKDQIPIDLYTNATELSEHLSVDQKIIT